MTYSVSYSKRSIQGHVRFKEDGGAGKALVGLTSGLSENEKPKLLGAPSELRVLEGIVCLHLIYLCSISGFAGKEEEDYWAKVEASKKNKVTSTKGYGGQKRKYRHHSGHRPPSKQPKTED